MTKKIIVRNIFLGFLSWLIPFVVSFLFYKPGGELVVSYPTFKSLIMVVGVISGCYLLFQYFKEVTIDFIKHGIIVGLSWFGINIILDTIVLIPIMKTSFTEYFMSIGISYFAIPVISITMAYLLTRKTTKNENK